MSKPSKVVVAVIVVILLGILWFGNSQTRKQAATEPIKIGVIAPLSGDFAEYGENLRNGVEAGVASSTSIQVIYEDEKCDPKTAVSAFHKLTDIDKVHFIIGPGCGSPQEAVVPLLDTTKTVVIVPSAASRDLYAKSAGWFYNIQYALEDESKFVAGYMSGLYKKVALITYANAFSNTHAKSFRANYKGTIAVDSVLTDDNTNLLPELTKIKAAKVDAIYAPDVAFFFAGGTAKLKQLKISAPVYTTYVADLPAVLPLIGSSTYSFPADVTDPHGAVYALSRQAAETLTAAISLCGDDSLCVKGKLSSSGKFDGDGVFRRDITLKRLVNGVPFNLFFNAK